MKIIAFSTDDVSTNERKGSPVWYNNRKVNNVNKSINSNRRPHDQVFSPEVFLVTRKKFDSNFPENPGFLISFFPIFRNHSGDRSIGLLRSRLYPSALFDGQLVAMESSYQPGSY